LFKKLIAFLTGKGNSPAPAPLAPAAVPPQFPVRRLSAGDPGNPFKVDGYDCLSFVRSRVAIAEPAIAETFATLRKNTGLTYAGELPADPIEIQAALEYPGEQVRDGMLYKAGKLEEKWDIYLYEQHLYFCRSWTGTLVYVASFQLAQGKITIGKIWVAREASAEDSVFAIQEVDYLLKSHVMQRRVPHPLPPDLHITEETIGQYSFSQYGHICCFGTYADTLDWDMLKTGMP